MAEQIVRTKGGVVHPIVLRVLEELGHDISHARRIRQISAADFAERVGISRATLFRLEKGDPGVSLHTLAMALHALGRLEGLATLANAATDDIGLMQSRRKAPRRIARPGRHRPPVASGNDPDPTSGDAPPEPEGW